MLYQPPTGGAANDPYVGANPGAGIAGSKVPPKAIEHHQRELIALITKSGLAPDEADLTQVAQAVQSGALNYAVATGTANAWVVALPQNVPAYAAGRVLNIKAPATNTAAAVTAAVSGLATRPVKRSDGTDLAIGDVLIGRIYATIDDGTNIRILSSLPSDNRSVVADQLQKFVIVADQKTAGTSGGTFTAGAWRTRDLNTVVSDPAGLVGSGITLASNRVTLPAGKWLIEASAPALACDGHKTRLYNITDSSVIAHGTTEQVTAPGTGDQVQTRSQLVCTMTLAATKTFELQHVAISTSIAGIGFGVASDYGLGANNGVETYAIFRASKLD